LSSCMISKRAFCSRPSDRVQCELIRYILASSSWTLLELALVPGSEVAIDERKGVLNIL
jgi:hypothetical protein